MNLQLPYGRDFLSLNIPDDRLQGVLTSGLHRYKPEADQNTLVERALENPVGTSHLYELARGKKQILLLASDHTRPVPSRAIIPPVLRELRRGSPDADITILIATGCHRATTRDVLREKFGDEIVAREKIVVHDCDEAEFVNIGTSPSGGACIINRLVMDADLVVAEGFIEPHFFAGYSGSRKSILPGVANRKTVLANHCSAFIASPAARTGILEGNPIHADMVWAARAARLAFVVNAVINEKKEAVYVVAGDMEKAHEAGCKFLSDLCGVEAKPADIVVTTNGGYPLDQNIYQAVKGMTAAEATVKDGGVIVMLSRSEDGHGGEHFYRQMAEEPDIEKTRKMFLSRSRDETEPDQWQTQIFIRVLQKASVIFVSDAPDEMVRALHMTPAHTLEEALRLAEERLGNPGATITVIPDGVSVIVKSPMA